ncbi:hypothetical protein B0H63DRAFT_528702 [Podospora didyma]|uniref:Oxidase ustYa n=1 Tax=Podospora didyma TaxID=330526 RepID=A0AAE0K1J0_9PEZI|nr:hypothetical protein B0H63DRAFT_528702 [Podospora didyma]
MSQQKAEYKTVSSQEDPEEARSSTEIGDSHLDEEKGWKTQRIHGSRSRGWHEPRTRTTNILSTFQLWRGVIDTGLLLIILTLLVLLLRKDTTQTATQNVLQIGGDYTGAGRQIITKVIKWNADPAFVPNKTTDFFSAQTLAKWNTLMPANAGWAPTGGGGGDSETFSTTSMTHQLHCLFMMGRVYAGVTENMTHRLPHDYHVHFLHCIDYLRQGITCAGDTALEPHSALDPDDLGPLDGSWQGMHVCKDYGEVLGYLEGQIKEGVRTVLPIDD